jgi:hypothetical protein
MTSELDNAILINLKDIPSQYCENHWELSSIQAGKILTTLNRESNKRRNKFNYNKIIMTSPIMTVLEYHPMFSSMTSERVSDNFFHVGHFSKYECYLDLSRKFDVITLTVDESVKRDITLDSILDDGEYTCCQKDINFKVCW